jgi:hypothetical protein
MLSSKRSLNKSIKNANKIVDSIYSPSTIKAENKLTFEFLSILNRAQNIYEEKKMIIEK